MRLSATQKATVKQIASCVLSALSPEELGLVDDYVETKPSRKFDGMLGFGVDIELGLILPALLASLQEIASTATIDIAERYGYEVARWLAGQRQEPPRASELQKLEAVLQQRLLERLAPERANEVAECVVSTFRSRAEFLRKLTESTERN